MGLDPGVNKLQLKRGAQFIQKALLTGATRVPMNSKVPPSDAEYSADFQELSRQPSKRRPLSDTRERRYLPGGTLCPRLVALLCGDSGRQDLLILLLSTL